MTASFQSLQWQCGLCCVEETTAKLVHCDSVLPITEVTMWSVLCWRNHSQTSLLWQLPCNHCSDNTIPTSTRSKTLTTVKIFILILVMHFCFFKFHHVYCVNGCSFFFNSMLLLNCYSILCAILLLCIVAPQMQFLERRNHEVFWIELNWNIKKKMFQTGREITDWVSWFELSRIVLRLS